MPRSHRAAGRRVARMTFGRLSRRRGKSHRAQTIRGATRGSVESNARYARNRVCCRSRAAILPENPSPSRSRRRSLLDRRETRVEGRFAALFSRPPRRVLSRGYSLLFHGAGAATEGDGRREAAGDETKFIRVKTGQARLSMNTSGSLLRSDWAPRGGVCAFPAHAPARRSERRRALWRGMIESLKVTSNDRRCRG